MGAYSELDAALREDGGGFVADDAFAEDGDPCTPSPDGTGNVLRAEPVSVSPAQPAEPQTAALAQPADNKAAKATKEQADADARKAHEEAEAKRKAEWEAKQQKKKEAEQQQLSALDAMSDEELLAASLKRVGDDTEKLTRRNMKECVAEHIQTLCLSDPAFARKVMHPRKSMIHCIWYINRKAREFIEQELKDNGFPKENGVYGSDVPDGVCYQWAVDYFNDPDAKEDHEEEEKFVPKPYIGGASKSKGGKAAKDKADKKVGKAEKPRPKEEPKKPAEPAGQFSFEAFMVPEEKAG